MPIQIPRPFICAALLAVLPFWAAPARVLAHDVQATESVESLRITVTSEARTREVLILRPTAAATTPAPALVLLHYLHGTPADMADLTGAARLSRDFGAWVILPDGINGKWSYGRLALKLADDVGFLDAVLDEVLSRFPIDPKRVYMAGYSNGGLMAERFACERAQRIAAVAVVATTIENPDAGRCRPNRGTPILFIHGVDDPIVPFQGNPLRFSADRVLALWRSINQCTDAVAESPAQDRLDDGTRLRRRIFPECAEGNPVQQMRVEGGGHTWPGSVRLSQSLGRTSQEFDATTAIWQFVSAFSRP